MWCSSSHEHAPFVHLVFLLPCERNQQPSLQYLLRNVHDKALCCLLPDTERTIIIWAFVRLFDIMDSFFFSFLFPSIFLSTFLFPFLQRLLGFYMPHTLFLSALSPHQTELNLSLSCLPYSTHFILVLFCFLTMFGFGFCFFTTRCSSPHFVVSPPSHTFRLSPDLYCFPHHTELNLGTVRTFNRPAWAVLEEAQPESLNTFEGTIPYEWGNLSKLTKLFLDKLTGS